MLYVISLLLFLLGIAAFGIAFSLPAFQALVFVAGILLIALAMALPIHLKAK